MLTSVLLILSSPTSFFLAREMRDRGAPLSRSLSLPRSVYVLLGDRPGGDLSVSVYIKLERERGDTTDADGCVPACVCVLFCFIATGLRGQAV